MDHHIQTMLEAMTDIVADERPWQDKRKAILAKAKEHQPWETALLEITNWFGEEVDEEEDVA